MALTLGDNFSYQGAKPLDARLTYADIATMKAVADATMYNGCVAYCVAADKTYQWKSTNTVDETLGKWREFESGGGGGTSDYSDLTNKPSIEGVTLSGNKTAADLGLAKSSQIPSTSDCYKTGDSSFTAIADGDYVPMYDISASAKVKSTWSNIKSVLKTYFDTLYNKVTNGTGLNLSNGTMSIKQFESGDMAEVIPELPEGNTLVSIANAFNKSDIYSTSEKMIGQWVNGKPVYMKSVAFGSLPNSTTKNVAHGISSLGEVVKIQALGKTASGNYYTISWADRNSISNNINIQVTSSNISITTSANLTSETITYVTLLYTKSTDSSVSIGEETEYSTSEKIVGSWIDGKGLYQCSIEITLPTVSTDGTKATTSIDISSLNIGKCVKIDGVFWGSGNKNTNSVNTIYHGASSTKYGVRCYVNSTGTSLGIDSDYASFSGRSGVVTLQYTKA